MLLDPNIMKKSGRIMISGELAEEYKITDIDGKLNIDQAYYLQYIYMHHLRLKKIGNISPYV